MGWLNTLWNWLANRYKQSLGGNLIEFAAHILAAEAAMLARLIADIISGVGRLIAWAKSQFAAWFAALQLAVWRLLGLILRDFQILWKRDWRLNRLAEAYARQQDRALYFRIEREAVSGYRTGYNGRISVITRILEYAAQRIPLLRGVIDRIIGGILDFLSIDNPLARWLVVSLLSKVASRMGVDRLAGEFAADLIAPLAGQPKPQGLHDVVTDISERLIAGEKQWAQFYANGGSEVEQAGSEWQAITGPLGDVAILAFVALAVTDPAVWARDIQDTAGRAAYDVIGAAARLFGG